MVRHHLGEREQNNVKLCELETNIGLLNDKLVELDQQRQLCLDQFNDLKQSISQMEDQGNNTHFKARYNGGLESKAQSPNEYMLPMKIIDKYLEHLNKILNLDSEPYLILNPIVDTKSEVTSNPSSVPSSPCQIPRHLHNFQRKKTIHKSDFTLSLGANSAMSRSLHSPVPGPQPSQLKTNLVSRLNDSSRSSSLINIWPPLSHHHPQSSSRQFVISTHLDYKRQCIKQSYHNLIHNILPKLYGHKFEHRTDPAYIDYHRMLTSLMVDVEQVPVVEEQRLVNSKQMLTNEIGEYLNVLNQMVTCTDKHCQVCFLDSSET